MSMWLEQKENSGNKVREKDAAGAVGTLGALAGERDGKLQGWSVTWWGSARDRRARPLRRDQADVGAGRRVLKRLFQ